MNKFVKVDEDTIFMSFILSLHVCEKCVKFDKKGSTCNGEEFGSDNQY